MRTPTDKIVTPEAAKQWRLRCAVQGYRVAVVIIRHCNTADAALNKLRDMFLAADHYQADAHLVVLPNDYPMNAAGCAEICAMQPRVQCVTIVPASDCAALIRDLAPDVTLPAAPLTRESVAAPAAPLTRESVAAPAAQSGVAECAGATTGQVLANTQTGPAHSATPAPVGSGENHSPRPPEAFSAVSDLQHSVRNAVG